MDQELFIIEVLSAKQKLSRKRKKSEKNNVQAFKLSIFLWFAFFGAVSFLYRHMSAVVRSAEGMQKLNNLYHFSWGVGGITIVVLIVFFYLFGSVTINCRVISINGLVKEHNSFT